ncbi:MFS transporter [Legionella pneumophila]|uniref:Major facilitator superfamily transporter n=1 Tax=Legionella pneumophila subsp. pascullei TaxID=91890 RepID=A0AAX2ISS0_LEGPN|nr:MFS transporter [Legionella pneumophila]AMP88440.1 MFS transporter [Legionella pneumophila subsp. pascullei]AMP91349.1 MFS transporter [Legionella pneumophila subsp. pascullei]AMP94337.1 MFS transporter [Legionella pneumophila subsp. pascullei]SQG89129.1 major facilitator superfamily transporter [Legionella pneumophila subsp. pascullei]VEH04179.1 major facilitator superfamily transporter [Legionella pneumophila subsp. pascullei]
MYPKTKLSFITLLLLISFASVNAVLFTPALPNITVFFGITEHAAQQTITSFLIGYALGQLIYGPMANRYGRKRTLYVGISLQIISSILCVLAGMFAMYSLLVLGRFLLALGSGVGLKMTFTLVNESYAPKLAAQKTSYLMLAFAIAPGLSVALGGILNSHYGWESCFYAGIVYGFILLVMVRQLPETQKSLQLDAFQIKHLLHGYVSQFKNKSLISGGALMGGASCFVYLFAATAPFIAINLLGMSTAEYGLANILPSLGLTLGSVLSAQFAKKYSQRAGIQLGISISGFAALTMMMAALTHYSALIKLFLPMIFLYLGLSFIFANASTFAMNHTSDKAHGSAVMNFINMGLVTVVILGSSLLPMSQYLLPAIYIILCILMMGLFFSFIKSNEIISTIDRNKES